MVLDPSHLSSGNCLIENRPFSPVLGIFGSKFLQHFPSSIFGHDKCTTGAYWRQEKPFYVKLFHVTLRPSICAHGCTEADRAASHAMTQHKTAFPVLLNKWIILQ